LTVLSRGVFFSPFVDVLVSFFVWQRLFEKFSFDLRPGLRDKSILNLIVQGVF